MVIKIRHLIKSRIMKKFLYRLIAATLLVFFPILALTDSVDGQILEPTTGNAFLSDSDDPEGDNAIPGIQKAVPLFRPSAVENFISCRAFFLPDDRVLRLLRAVTPPFAMRAPPMPHLV